MTDISMIGIILGFATTGIFILYALVNIVIDEAQRHTTFKKDVEKASQHLIDEYDCSDKDIEDLKEEFEIAD